MTTTSAASRLTKNRFGSLQVGPHKRSLPPTVSAKVIAADDVDSLLKNPKPSVFSAISELNKEHETKVRDTMEMIMEREEDDLPGIPWCTAGPLHLWQSQIEEGQIEPKEHSLYAVANNGVPAITATYAFGGDDAQLENVLVEFTTDGWPNHEVRGSGHYFFDAATLKEHPAIITRVSKFSPKTGAALRNGPTLGQKLTTAWDALWR